MIFVNADMSGLDRLWLRLEGVATDLSEPIEEALLEVQDIVATRFEKEDDGTRRWKNLSERRIKERGSAHPILRDEGKMFASIFTRGAQDNVFKLERMLGVVGTRDMKARKHQDGDPKTNLPRRAFMTLTKADREDLGELFRDYLREQMSNL